MLTNRLRSLRAIGATVALALAVSPLAATSASAQKEACSSFLDNRDSKAEAECREKARVGDVRAQSILCHWGGGGRLAGDCTLLAENPKADVLSRASAQDMLAFLYREGSGGAKKDYAKAFNFCKQAADQYYTKAASCMREAYQHGKGTTKNLVQAYKYLLLDLQFNSTFAAPPSAVMGENEPGNGMRVVAEARLRELADMEANLSKAQLKDGGKQASDWYLEQKRRDLDRLMAASKQECAKPDQK